MFCAADLDLTLTGDSAYECFQKVQSAMTQAEVEVDLKASYSHDHAGSGVAAAISIVATESALGTGASDGELKICADSGNRYTWESTGSKWRAMDGNKYTTANLPTSTTYNIATGTRVFDTTTGSWKEYNGSAWWEPIPLAVAAEVGLPLVATGSGNTITLNPITATAIKTAKSAADPGSAYILYNDGWRKQSVTIVYTATSIPQSTIMINAPIPSGHRRYQCELNNLQVTSSLSLYATVNANTANYSYGYAQRITRLTVSDNGSGVLIPSITGTYAGSASANHIDLGAIEDRHVCDVVLDIYGVTATSWKHMDIKTTVKAKCALGHSAGTASEAMGSGILSEESTINALIYNTARLTGINIFPDADAFATGTVTLLGYK